MRTHTMPVSVAVAMAFTMVLPAFAGPEWDEGAKDAGASAGSAQTVAGSSGTGVTSVRGQTSLALLGAADMVDMFVVKTGSNPFDFAVDMNMGPGGTPGWGARLTLFKKVWHDCGGAIGPNWVVYARPVATVVKANAAQPFPILDGNALINGATGARLGSLLSADTEYFVAVTGAGESSIGVRENCTDNGPPQNMFANATGYGIYALSVSDSNSFHLVSWDGSGSTAGAYAMPTRGVFPVPASSCLYPVPISGAPLSIPFDFNIAPSASGIVSCAGPSWPVNRQYYFAWSPQCTGDAVVTTCGFYGGDSAIEVFEVDPCNPDYCAAVTTNSIACDDECGTGHSSEVSFSVTAGREYVVWLTRVSALGGAASWQGTIKFQCDAPTPAPSGDVNGDGIVNASDLGILLGQWGTAGP